MESNLIKELRDLNENTVYRIVQQMVEQGRAPADIISECNAGMVQVGDLFADGKYYLSELLFSADIMQGVMVILKPLLESGEDSTSKEKIRTVVIGTVKDDIHDIGKNIVVSMLRSHKFNVIDPGVDVPADKFIQAVKKNKAKVLGLSALLNNTYPQMKNVVDALVDSGLREQVKVIIGGTICSETIREYTHADFYANDVVTGINICNRIFEAQE